ncbi:uncharacterized protein [Choristoneura fumiferana]|uniref:uncharacterized protein n=1 Tax=Choristoneura fumiferana TaxID=7141 RepID=UPI003D15418E
MHLALVCAVIIGMPGFAECLRESAVVVADGTFLTVPAGLQAYQLLTLHTVAMGQHYHPVVALMENRRQHLYRAVLQKVWELAGNPEPATVISDYEPALQGALPEVTDAPLHFLQALVKRGSPCAWCGCRYATLAQWPVASGQWPVTSDQWPVASGAAAGGTRARGVRGANRRSNVSRNSIEPPLFSGLLDEYNPS